LSAQPAQGTIVRAALSGDGVLLSADYALLMLQREAGGDLNQPLAIPQLAAVARIANRLGVTISRTIVAATQRRDIDMWVRAKPEGGAISLAVTDWNERPTGDMGAPNGQRDADIGASAEGWTWEVDVHLRFQMVLAGSGDGLPPQPPRTGSQFTGYFRLEADADGDMSMLRGLAQRRAFRDQPAVLAGDDAARLTLSGFPLFDLSGKLVGYRGKAQPVRVEAKTAVEPIRPLTFYPATFGKRLDRSLRQPLGRIIANADTISAELEGPLRPDYVDYAADIASAARHLMALVDDLADLQAIDRPDFTVAREAVDLADLGRRAAGLLTVKALDRQIRLLQPQADASVSAVGEFRRILQILVNLIGNAVRYSPEGSQVRIETGLDGDKAHISIADEGPGIAPEDRERIFAKFERLGRDDAGGSGLGLYISRRLARAMGGDIRIGGTPGEGARFTLILPTR